jgi:hypothetical protein
VKLVKFFVIVLHTQSFKLFLLINIHATPGIPKHDTCLT